MTKPWAISGLDLHLDLAGTGVRTALEAALRDAVRSGRLGPGTRLPSSRALANDLGIARNTVADAYGELISEGWLVARQGSGTVVADRAQPAAQARLTPPAPTQKPSGHLRFDLRAGSPDLSSFPRTAWLASARRALNAAPSQAFGYGDPRGRPELRAALADYLARARGVRVTPERIVVCSGFTQGLGLLCQVIGGSLAIESYGLPANRDTALAHGLTLSTLPIDEGGAHVEALDEKAVLLTPAHQFPLGQALSPARRNKVVRWAEQTGGLVIEDDYDGEFRYDRQPIGALQSLSPEHVVYAGTASKTLAPGLRMGWLVVPAYLLDAVIAAKAAADRTASAFDQLTLADFITSGGYDRHVRGRRLTYRRRRDQLVAQLGRRLPELPLLGLAAGLHALLELPRGQDEADVVERAADRGLAVEGLDAYRLSPDQRRPALVIGYASPPDHDFAGAVARLCAVLRKAG